MARIPTEDKMRRQPVLASAALVCTSVLAGAETPAPDTASKFLAHIPLSFERNAGQTAGTSAGWIGQANGYHVALSATGATLVPVAPGRADVVRMQLLGARPHVAAEALEPLPGRSSYLIGRDPKRWIQDLPTYGRIAYHEAYEGIDVAWYGNQGRLEYDFLLKPGADANLIRVRIDGARKLALESGGDLRIETAAGSMTMRVPEVYQDIAGARRRVDGRYVLRAANEIAFRLAPYDKSKPLVIDPTLAYGTYFGAGLSVTALTTDTSGNVYIGGAASTGVPMMDPRQAGSLGSSDVWIAKFNSTGTTLLYSTYVGGSAEDNIVSQSSIAVDSTGEIIVGGQTFSTDFPLQNPVQSEPPPAGFCLPFAFKLNAAGNMLVYSTYLGGNPPDGATAWAVTVDTAGNAYIAGEADGGFATTAGVYQTAYGGGYSDAFVVKLSITGALTYSTMMGGSGLDIADAIVADASGNAYLAGHTGSTSFPKHPPGAVTTNAGQLDVFVAKLNATGTKVAWLTLLGGSGDDLPAAMVRNASTGELYIAGHTYSPNFPTTPGVLQPAANGPEQGFVASVAADGMSYGFVTYLGGGRNDSINALAFTSSGLVVGGTTTSANFPVSNAIQRGFTGLATTLYATTNSGATWTPSDAGLPNLVIGVVPDPSNSGNMLAASGDNFEWFQTANGGASWTDSGSASLYLYYHAAGAQLLGTPADTSVIYAAYPYSIGLDNGSSLIHYTWFLAFRSSDAGVTWKPLSLPPNSSTDTLAGLVVSPTKASEIDEIDTSGNVYQSTNGGGSFSQIATLPSVPTWGFTGAVTGSPDGSIYVAACNLLKSTDFGLTWTSSWLGECIASVAVSPTNPSIVYAANAYGLTLDVYQSTNAGGKWTQLASPALSDVQGAVLVVAPSDPSVLYAASGNQVSIFNGTSWSTPVTIPGTVWTIGVSASDAAIAYAGVGPSSNDGFAAKLSTNGQTLLWSTFYSGSGGASVNAAAPDGSSSAWIAGSASAGLPLSLNAYNSNAYGGTGFLARISDATAACSFALSPSSILAYGTETISFTVTAPSGCAWSATPSSWITLQSGSSGIGSAVVSATLAANHTGATRPGSINIGGQSFAITQAASGCTYSLPGGNTISVPQAGGTVQIAVTAPATCPWSAVPESPLISVVSGGSGKGPGTVTLSMPANDSVVWLSPTVQIATETATLQQLDACTYQLSPQTLPDTAASGTMTVTANLAGCSWSPTSSQTWLTVSGSGTGSGTFPYTVTENTTGASRSANVTLDHQAIQVTQEP